MASKARIPAVTAAAGPFGREREQLAWIWEDARPRWWSTPMRPAARWTGGVGPAAVARRVQGGARDVRAGGQAGAAAACAPLVGHGGGASIGPMRYTNRVCKPGERPYELCEGINIFTVEIVSSDVGFPINVYGTVIARDTIDLKCVYLFRRNRDDSELINCKEEPLTLTGPKRGLALIDDAYVEFDLKIKGDGEQNDKELSKGFVTIDGIARRWLQSCVVESRFLSTRLSTVKVLYGVVKDAVEATIAIEVVHGDFYEEIIACTTSIPDYLVLHDGIVDGTRIGEEAMQLLQSVVAVCLKESLFVIIVAHTDCGETEKEIEFTPKVNGGDAEEITVCGTTMLVKVVWSIIDL